MIFEMTERARDLHARVSRFMDEHIFPSEALAARQIGEGDRWQPAPIIETLKAKARAQGLWNLFLPGERARRRSHEPGVRAAVRADGTLGHRRGAVQLLGAGHRQHGDAGALRWRGDQARVARAAARGRDPLRVLHDRARRRVFRCDQRALSHRARRRPLRAERPQVVVLRRRRSALQGLHLHGQDRPGRGEAPAAVDDRGAARHPGSHDRAHALGLRLRPRPAWPRGDHLRERPRAREEHAARRGPRLRDRAGPARSRAHPPLHAVDRCGGARPVPDVRAGARPRSLRAAAVGDGLDSPRHRAVADRDRPGPADGAQRRPHDGHGRKQGGAQGDIDDQGHRAVDGAAGDRPRGAGARGEWGSRETPSSPPCGRTSVRSASRTARTRCTSKPSRGASSSPIPIRERAAARIDFRRAARTRRRRAAPATARNRARHSTAPTPSRRAPRRRAALARMRARNRRSCPAAPTPIPRRAVSRRLAAFPWMRTRLRGSSIWNDARCSRTDGSASGSWTTSRGPAMRRRSMSRAGASS